MKALPRKYLVVLVVLALGSVGNGADIAWIGGGGENLWSNPANWSSNTVPTVADEIAVEAPAATAPNGPLIQDGIDAKAKLLFCELPGEPTMTMTGGTLELTGWGIWWADGPGCHATFTMSGGTIDFTGNPGICEMAWQGSDDPPGSSQGTWIMTGGTVNAKGADIPAHDKEGIAWLYLYGGTFNVGTSRGGLNLNKNGLIEITEGTLVLEGDEVEKVEKLIANTDGADGTIGLITCHGGEGTPFLDYDVTNPGMTTLTSRLRIPNDPNAPGFPTPDDGATVVEPNDILTWDPGLAATSRDVYFGTDPEALSLLVEDLRSPSVDPVAILGHNLDSCTTYYWQVVERDDPNAPTWEKPGLVWSFTTRMMTDINGDNFVDMEDFSQLASHWLDSPCAADSWCGGADVNWSKAVNEEDLDMLVLDWLHTCAP